MKVFVSSTSYDLLDVRAEITLRLSEMGLTPVLSDQQLSEFDVKPQKNSIEVCLLNVRSSDWVIVILDQRYGPSLKKAGLPDFSATHLEYLEARNHQRPILFYVRDRLEADYWIWKKASDREKLRLSWVKDPKDFRLFELLEKHRELHHDSETSNWVSCFHDSVELKRLIGRDLHIPASKIRLEALLKTGDIPAASIAILESDHDTERGELWLDLRNVGAQPMVKGTWEFVYEKESQEQFYKSASDGESGDDPWEQEEDFAWIAADDAMRFHISSDIVNCLDRFRVQVKYHMPSGEGVTDLFVVVVSSITFLGNVRRYSSDPHGKYKFHPRLVNREYTPADANPDLFKIRLNPLPSDQI